jgi:hypothetical protein
MMTVDCWHPAIDRTTGWWGDHACCWRSQPCPNSLLCPGIQHYLFKFCWCAWCHLLWGGLIHHTTAVHANNKIVLLGPRQILRMILFVFRQIASRPPTPFRLESGKSTSFEGRSNLCLPKLMPSHDVGSEAREVSLNRNCIYYTQIWARILFMKYKNYFITMISLASKKDSSQFDFLELEWRDWLVLNLLWYFAGFGLCWSGYSWTLRCPASRYWG